MTKFQNSRNKHHINCTPQQLEEAYYNLDLQLNINSINFLKETELLLLI